MSANHANRDLRSIKRMQFTIRLLITIILAVLVAMHREWLVGLMN